MKRSWEGLEINPLIPGDRALWYTAQYMFNSIIDLKS